MAQTMQQFECSYESTARLTVSLGTLPIDSQLSMNWEFVVMGSDGVIPTDFGRGVVESGRITYSHPTEGAITYMINRVVVVDAPLSDRVTTAFANQAPQGQLGGLSLGFSNQQGLSLAIANQANGAFDILTDQNYPLDSDTLNRFTTRRATIIQNNVDGTVRNVLLEVGPISGGCSQVTGEQIFVDVRPSSYPNIIRLNNARFLVAIPGAIGNDDFFDTLDKNSFNIQGVPAVGVRNRLSDLTTMANEPVTDEPICQTGLADGNNDLIIVWDSAPIIDLFPDFEDGVQVPITIEGNLLDGTPIFGNDFIVIDRGE